MSLNIPIRRASMKSSSSPPTTFICSQCRHASLLRRPKRPYTFTQLITLSDGSTFTHRTTSPEAVYRSTRDTRNAPMWNPSSQLLVNAEEDEAGRLAAFRSKFGRAWDAASPVKEAASDRSKEPPAASAEEAEDTEGEFERTEMENMEQQMGEEEDDLLNLISSYGMDETTGGKKK